MIKIAEIERCIDCHRAWNTRVANSIGYPMYIGEVEDEHADAYEIVGILCEWCDTG